MLVDGDVDDKRCTVKSAKGKKHFQKATNGWKMESGACKKDTERKK